MPNFSIDITEGMGPSEIKVKPNGMNLTTNPLTGYVKVRTSDGFSQSIPLTQKTGNFTYKYYLEANPATIQIDSFGGSATLNITSRKETYLDGELIETDENWGYSLSADPGITLNGLTVTVGENVNNYDVTSKVVVTQNESGKKIEITIQQLAGEVVGEYEFSVSPTSLSFAALGQSRTFTITSMYHYTFNGEWRDDSVPWQVQSITSPFQVSGNTVTIGENTNTSARTGSLVLIQPASRKTVTITLSQAAAEITYSYNFSVSPSSLEFVATGETKTVSITSTRDRYVNGKYSSTENWNYTRSNGANVSGSGTSITMGENTGSNDRSGSVTFTQTTSGKSVTVTCKQSAAQIETEYVFTVSPESLTFENTGGTQNFTVTSTKTVTINGTPTTTNLDYTISGSVSGFSITKGSVTASANSGDSSRSGNFTLKQSESGKTITLSVSQGAASIETTYEFSVSPTSMEFEAVGGSKGFTITSTKTVTTNGVPTTTNIGYTFSSDTTGITVNGNDVVVGEITEDGRTGVITFTQNESGKTCTITITQGAASIDYIFQIKLSTDPDSAFGDSVSLSYTSDSKAAENYTIQTKSKKVVNGEETDIGYDTESDSSWIVVTKTGSGTTGSGFSWTILENTNSSPRNGKIILTQKESGKKVYINISQEAAVVESWKYFLFSTAMGNAISIPGMNVEKEVNSDGSGVDIEDWVFGFAVKTLDGALVIGNDNLDLNGWAELLINPDNFGNVMRLNTIKVTGATLESLIRSNTQTELQYYSLTPNLTLDKNTTGQSRKVRVQLSLNENPSLVLTYTLTQLSAEPIFTWEDGTTVKDLGIFGEGGSNERPTYVYNNTYYPRLRLRSVLSDGEPFGNPGTRSGSIEVDDHDDLTSMGKNPVGTISNDTPEIIEFYFGFYSLERMMDKGSPGQHTITIYQLDREGARTGKSITLKYSLTGTYLKYTLSYKRAATAIYDPMYLIPGLSEIVVGIRTISSSQFAARTLPNVWTILDGGIIGDASKSRNIFNWDWDSIEAIREVANNSTFYFGNGVDGQYTGTSNFNSPGGYGTEQNISPDDRGVYTPSEQGNEFTITVITINKSS